MYHLFIDRLRVYNLANVESFYNLTDDNFEGAYLANSLRVDYFNIVNDRKAVIRKSKEYIRSLTFCMYFRKHSCLIEPFNQQIAAFTSSGLINFWAKKFKKSLQNKSGQTEPKPISVDQIVGIIIVCGGLLTVSIIVFILELLSTRIGVIKRILDFLMFNKIWDIQVTSH